MTPKMLIVLALTLSCACWPSTARGQAAAAATTSATIDREAMSALDKMGAYLRTLKAFQIRSTTALDDVLDDGQKIQNDGVVDLLVQRPDRMRAEISSDAQHRMFFYDGKNFSIWARRVNYYATVPAPPSLGELVDRLADNYGIEVPMVDLFYWGTEKASTRSITSAIDAGASQVDGVSCQHYAFRQDGLDWQIWIQNGEYPLPRKLVLTTTSEAARPQYTTVMTWNLAPSFNDAAFTFTPPPDAQKIAIASERR